MPTYEYVCQACSHTFDELQLYSEPLLKKCPKCKKNKLKRSFGTGAAILFKGSGFYETDYRSDSYKTAAKADADAGKPASGSTNNNSTSGGTGSSSSGSTP